MKLSLELQQTPTKPTNLEILAAACAGLTHRQSAAIDGYMLGAVSSYIDRELWETLVQNAKEYAGRIA